MPVRLVAKTLVQRPDGKVLILRRSRTDTHRPGECDLPGGGVDDGEDILASAAREVLEESGIDVRSKAFRVLYAHTTYETEVAIRILCYCLVEESEVRLSFEHDEYWWMSVEKAILSFGGRNWGQNIEFAARHHLLM